MPQKEHVFISDLHYDHKIWLNELNFYSDELKIFKERLEYVIKRNTEKDFLAQAERFQNQFIRQKEVRDEVRHEIKQAENQIEKFAKDHPIAIDHVHFNYHTQLAEQMETYRSLYMEMKQEFMKFLVKWM
jgi:hypothetical protein